MSNKMQNYIHSVVNSGMGFKRLFWLLIYLFPVYVSLGQTRSDSSNLAKLLTSFSFRQFSGGVMVIRGCIENIPDSFNFVLDTGSGGISLDSSTCAQYQILNRPTDTLIKGIAGVRKVSFAFDHTLRLPGLTVPHLNFHINNYEVLSSVYGEKIDGIIGYSFFRRFIVEVNFDSLRINVYQPGKMAYPQHGYLLHPNFTSIPIEDIRFRDDRRNDFPFYIDSGAGLCFLLSEQLVADSAILKKKRKPIVTQAEGMGGRLRMRLTVIKSLKLGPYRFNKVPVFIYDDVNNILNYPAVGGMIGNDLLRRFNVIYNYPLKEIHLQPNSHFTDEFDYAYTGLGIYQIEDKVLVLDVITGSPAEKAGIRVNDEIIGINNLIHQHIQAYKNALQVKNQRVTIIILREGKLMEIKMKTGSIL